MIRQALRSLRKSPAYTLTSIVTLGLGIGLTTAAFSLLNGLVLRPLPFPDPASLVVAHEMSATELCAGCGVGASFPLFEEWRSARSFSGLEAIVERPFNVASANQPAARIGGALVSEGLFRLLGVQPQIGRAFTVAEDRTGGMPVVIVSHALWREQLLSARLDDLSVRVNGVEHRVVGVMPPGFGFPEFTRLWLPLGQHAAGWPMDDRSLSVIGRLAADVTLTEARQELAGFAAGTAARYPATHRGWDASVEPLRQSLVGDEASLFWLLVGMVLVLLLVACVNLAGVGLARAVAREREFAVRAAMGATSGALLRLLLVESLWLAAGGGALGLLLGPWTVDLVRTQLPAELPAWLVFDLDWRVAIFSAVVTIAAGLAAGLLPALRASRASVVDSLKIGLGPGPDSQRLRLLLVGGELALALVLVIAAGLLTQTFIRALSADPGYDTATLLNGDIGLHRAAYDDPRAAEAFAADLDAAMTRIAGVRSAAVSRWNFVAGFGQSDRRMRIEGGDAPAGATPRFSYAVTPGYFATIGLSLQQGRGFTERDRAGTEPVAVVNDALAQRLWSGGSPLGRQVQLPDDVSRTVVGVVGNVAASGLATRRDPPSYLYVPFAQAPGRPISVHVRTVSRPYGAAPGVVEAVRALDRDEPVESLRSAEDAMSRELLPVRFAALLVDAVALLALLLAAVGLYGVVAYTVGRRTREFGIRMAIGARGVDVLGLVMRQAVGVTIAGVLAGAAFAAASTRLLASVLWGTNPLDPWVFLTSAALLAAVMFVATLAPARRAARIEPQTALRTE